MKHYLDLVPISAKVRRRQSRMSVFCISLAVFLVTAIFGMADMFIRSQLLQAKKDGGDYHIGIRYLTDEEASLISRRPDVASAARYGVLNYRNDARYTISGKTALIVGCDEAWVTEMLVDGITEGTFPQTDSEAMITESARERFGLQIGDPVTIDCPSGEELRFTLSGFCTDAAKTMSEDSYAVITTTDAFRSIYPAKKNESLEDYNSVLFVRFANPFAARRHVEKLKSDYGFSDEQIYENVKLMGLLGQSGTSFMLQIYASAAILFVLVLSAGILMIASSLNSNVAQRTSFFGMIRCIGATPRQIMRLVRKEALFWCRLAIPAGLACGILVIWVLCAVLRNLSPQYFAQMPVFGLSIPSILAGILVGLLTVLLAARSPARKAARVSPLAAVSGRVSEFQHTSGRDFQTGPGIFRIDTALGIHHAKAGWKNLLLMSGSFALSIVLFLSFSVTVKFMNRALTPLRPWTADLSIISPELSCSVERTLLEKLQASPAVKSAYGRMFAYDVPAAVESAEQKTDLISYEQHQFGWAEEYLLEGSIDAVQAEADTGLIVFEPENTIQVGDTVTLDIDGSPHEIRIAGMLSSSPFVNDSDTGIIICSEETFRRITGQNDYTILDIQLRKNASEKEVSAIKQMAGDSYTVSDDRMNNRSTTGTYYCFQLFLYGFLLLTALITVFHVINSISMSVSAREGQYGTFRAIGLSMRQLAKMIFAEACTYTVTGSILGTALGLPCNYILYNMMVTSRWGDRWTVPWAELGIILLIISLSVLLAVWGPVQKLRRMSITGTVRTQ